MKKLIILCFLFVFAGSASFATNKQTPAAQKKHHKHHKHHPHPHPHPHHHVH